MEYGPFTIERTPLAITPSRNRVLVKVADQEHAYLWLTLEQWKKTGLYSDLDLFLPREAPSLADVWWYARHGYLKHALKLLKERV